MYLYNCDAKMIKPPCHQKLLMRLWGGNRNYFKSHKNLVPIYDLLWGEGTNGQHDIFSEGHVEQFGKYMTHEQEAL